MGRARPTMAHAALVLSGSVGSVALIGLDLQASRCGGQDSSNSWPGRVEMR